MAGHYELEDRLERYAKGIQLFVRTVPECREKVVYGNQLLRSSSSAAANYLEGNEALTRKEKIHRFGISRRECKESRLFLRLLRDCGGDETERLRLENEAGELSSILTGILRKFGV